MRRGSSIKIFLAPSQAASSKVSGTMVLLPAPGGAWSSTHVFVARAAVNAGSASLMGNVGSGGRLITVMRRYDTSGRQAPVEWPRDLLSCGTWSQLDGGIAAG